jgi:hypothetical protein
VRLAWAAIALATVCLFWAGMVFANGFNTGIKFTAPTLTRAVGMDVGRVTFSAFNKIELFCCAITFCLFVFARPFRRAPRATGVLLALAWVIVALQSAFLLPALIERALLVIHGLPLPPSPVHLLYTSSELIKLIALLIAGVSVIRQLRNPAASDCNAQSVAAASVPE